MSQILKAVYHGGAFIPQAPCDVPEDAEVELIVQGPYVLPPEVTEPDTRAQILKVVIERMQQNPLPAGAPRLTRDALYKRR
jgi:hypothetical protein